jgi:hypothetical protein
MAHVFIGVDQKKGIVDQPASIAATTQTKAYELNIDLTKAASKTDILIALEKIKLAVIHAPYPPA